MLFEGQNREGRLRWGQFITFVVDTFSTSTLTKMQKGSCRRYRYFFYSAHPAQRESISVGDKLFPGAVGRGLRSAVDELGVDRRARHQSNFSCF